MKSEFVRFFLFLFLLSLIASSISSFRSKDKAYLYADGGLTEVISTGNESILSSFFTPFQEFWKKIILEKGGKTESGEWVYSHLLSRFLPTLHLSLFSILFGSGLAILFSLSALYLHSKVLDRFFNSISEIILSTPIFVAAVLLLLFFFYKWELFPPGGYEPFNTYYVVLPGLALGMRVFARIYIFQSKEVWEESSSPYVLLLKTRGYPWRHIVFKEIFLKLFPVTMILIVLDFGSLLSGAMVVEEIFFYPGIGKSLYFSIKSMDSQLLATLLLYTGIIFYLINRFALHLQKKLSGETNV